MHHAATERQRWRRTHDQERQEDGNIGDFKIPTSDPVQINRLGLAHDVIIDTKHHGGVDQAVYVFGQPDYEWWSAQLGVALEAGIFGENLTISDLESATMRIGDRLHIGSDVILEVTSPRIPLVRRWQRGWVIPNSSSASKRRNVRACTAV
ncbi:MAG: MOSC domain-containing protein [Anaerolineae bacterium]